MSMHMSARVPRQISGRMSAYMPVRFAAQLHMPTDMPAPSSAHMPAHIPVHTCACTDARTHGRTHGRTDARTQCNATQRNTHIGMAAWTLASILSRTFQSSATSQRPGAHHIVRASQVRIRCMSCEWVPMQATINDSRNPHVYVYALLIRSQFVKHHQHGRTDISYVFVSTNFLVL